MAKNKFDLYDCSFRINTGRIFVFQINRMRVNGEEHDLLAENIYNSGYISFDNDLDIDKYRLYNINDIAYDTEDRALKIDGDVIALEDFIALAPIVDIFDGDIDQCLEDLMNHFIKWFMENLGSL